MDIEKNYAEIFEEMVQGTQDYIVGNNLRAMVLGISGGIDSTVVAAICHEVAKRTGIPLIGRSLPTKYNKEGETSAADLVGKAFCNDYKVFNINQIYHNYLTEIILKESGEVNYDIDHNGKITYVQGDFLSPIAKGNIQARLRMIYLYNLASIHGGLVMDTDNLTENNLGYFTIHGDVGDFNPIGGLWKTEVFELAEWIMNWYGSYTHTYFYTDAPEVIEYKQGNLAKAKAIKESLKLKPTAGLGITNNDLEEIGAESYDQVDAVLKDILSWKCREDMFAWKEREHPLEDYLKEHRIKDIPYEIIERVAVRHFRSEFKRKQLPIKL